MADATEITHSSFGTIAALFVSAKDRLTRRRQFNQIVRELNALGDRELKEMGLSRRMIRRVAHQATCT